MLIYLASPYSHPDPSVMQRRFEEICDVAGRLMRDGVHLYSPIAHTHPIAVRQDLPRGWDFWKQYDEKLLAACSELWVCTMDAWEQSKGVAGEIEIALALGKPVRYIAP